jgi:hypothetical protein
LIGVSAPYLCGDPRSIAGGVCGWSGLLLGGGDG